MDRCISIYFGTLGGLIMQIALQVQGDYCLDVSACWFQGDETLPLSLQKNSEEFASETIA